MASLPARRRFDAILTGGSREFGFSTSVWLEIIEHGRILLQCDRVMYVGACYFSMFNHIPARDLFVPAHIIYNQNLLAVSKSVCHVLLRKNMLMTHGTENKG